MDKSCPKCGEIHMIFAHVDDKLTKDTGYLYHKCQKCSTVFPNLKSYLPPGLR